MPREQIYSAFDQLILERKINPDNQAQLVTRVRTKEKDEMYVRIKFRDKEYKKPLKVEFGQEDLDPNKSTVNIKINKELIVVWFYKADIQD